MTNLGPAGGAGAPAFPFPTADNHDENASPALAPRVEPPTEDALDHGIEESFPASDPVSVSVTAKLPAAPAASGSAVATAVAPTAPGDDAPAGTPGTGESLCRECGGSGRTGDGATCPACEGTGKVNVGIGGG
ncbi:MAG TPA: hypothetical protein VLK60_19375 [Variovorax sp.]|nr:hypothetical protein [Variovorax sp.]